MPDRGGGADGGVVSSAVEGAEPQAPECILIVEDDPTLRSTLTELLAGQGYRALASPDGRHALRVLQREPADLIVTDLVMPGEGGEALLLHVREATPEIPVIVMTAFGSLEVAVRLTRAGAAEYLPKPLSTGVLLDTVRRLLDESRPRRARLRARTGAGPHLKGLIGSSREMRYLFEQLGRVAPSPLPVLITGETGAGKDMVARALHRASRRDPFVPLNCGAIPEHLLESELFGHVRGAFTGADGDKIGLFEAAHGGTLFLDEISELPRDMQSKLLRVLQFGELRRVGEVKSRVVSVRVIAATNRDLDGEVSDGRFRRDLFYRINVISLHVPALREHPADIPLLADQVLAEIARRTGQPEKRLSPGALAAIISYDWPGNIRELRNCIERCTVFVDAPEIEVGDLPVEIRRAAPSTSSHALIGRDLTLAELERQHIIAVLRRVGGNRSIAARLLGIPRRTLYHRLREHGINPEQAVQDAVPRQPSPASTDPDSPPDL